MKPVASIIVVNFNGARFLPPCLESLEEQDYPRERFEVILVDNASSDGSVELVRERYPRVKVLVNRGNLGFSRGNNAGIRVARGEYLVLLNNDTRVDRRWLAALIDAAEADPEAGICTSKIRLLHKRLELDLSCKTFSPAALNGSTDARELGVCVESIRVEPTHAGPGRDAADFLAGFHPQEVANGRAFRWSGARSRIGVPVEAADSDLRVVLSMACPRPRTAGPAELEIRIAGSDEVLYEQREPGAPLPDSISLTIAPEQLSRAGAVVQNAGSIIFPNGASRDRGAVVVGTTQFFETDSGQYDRVEEVFAACGASMLLRREMLDDVGLLDESFFMYYEDTDLSWRARLRGWKVLYVPDSVVCHAHCGSTEEWSRFFVYQTERNRLAMVGKNGTVAQAAGAWFAYAAGALVAGARLPLHWLRGRDSPHLRTRAVTGLRVMLSLLVAAPGLVGRRLAIQRRRRVVHSDIAAWFRTP